MSFTYIFYNNFPEDKPNPELFCFLGQWFSSLEGLLKHALPTRASDPWVLSGA